MSQSYTLRFIDSSASRWRSSSVARRPAVPLRLWTAVFGARFGPEGFERGDGLGDGLDAAAARDVAFGMRNSRPGATGTIWRRSIADAGFSRSIEDAAPTSRSFAAGENQDGCRAVCQHLAILAQHSGFARDHLSALRHD